MVFTLCHIVHQQVLFDALVAAINASSESTEKQRALKTLLRASDPMLVAAAMKAYLGSSDEPLIPYQVGYMC
jgi:hypothetical protein